MMNEYTDLNIRHMKLVSGDEIIGLVRDVEVDRLSVIVERPLLIHTDLDVGTGRERYYLSDYMPVSKTSITHFSSMHIVAQCEVNESVKETYLKYCLNYETDGVIERDDEIPDDAYDDLEDDTTFH
jgi:hypothetical protein